MERGRPRTRRIIARVILPRCDACVYLSLSLSLSLFLSLLLLSPLPLCLRGPHWIHRPCVRELTSACERRLLSPRIGEPSEAGRSGGARAKEVRGQPHSRRGRRDAHRATPTRKSFCSNLRVFCLLPPLLLLLVFFFFFFFFGLEVPSTLFS